jgi:hypothetical protein
MSAMIFPLPGDLSILIGEGLLVATGAHGDLRGCESMRTLTQPHRHILIMLSPIDSTDPNS